MTVPRFYAPSAIVRDQRFALPQPVAHHAVRVLRLAVGDSLVLFDGSGGEHRVRIDRISGSTVHVTHEQFDPREAESPLTLWLGQALCAGDKMDWVFQKAVELGVSRCSPLLTERSQIRLAGERAARRQAHWQHVVEAACEQSGRNRVPSVDPLSPLRDWCASLPEGGMKLMLSPLGEIGLSQLSRPEGTCILLVGPEGGLSREEEEMARSSGFFALKLGPRVLRTETAALALMAALQGIWGDFVEALPSTRYNPSP